MKKKLDLNNLLAKYEGMAATSGPEFYSPAKGYDYKDGTAEDQFY